MTLPSYGRILSQIRNNEETGFPSAANRILLWLVCARCYVREKEVRQALTVETSIEGISTVGISLIDVQEACGPLIEVRDGIVHFVHFSAKEYVPIITNYNVLS